MFLFNVLIIENKALRY